MGTIYIDGRFRSTSGLTTIHKINEVQDNRLEKIEAVLDGSDGVVDNPEILNSMILNNSEKINNNTEDIQFLKLKIETIETTINDNTIKINEVTVSINSIDSKIDKLSEKIDNLDMSGLSWVEVLNN